MNKTIIPIFYACDDAFFKFTLVSLKSLIMNASKEYLYHIHILNRGISNRYQDIAKNLETEYIKIEFNNVSENLKTIENLLPLRDYYSMTTYYRMFLAQMFPQYEKAIYIDSDTIVQGDISKLYQYELGEHYVGAVNDPVIAQTPLFADYSEKVLGIERTHYFNAGVLLININAFRKEDVLKQFIKLVNIYNFVVAQDQDYLNVICKDNVYFLPPCWNSEVYGELLCKVEEMCIIHYNLAAKPWHYKECRLGYIFWEYAECTELYPDIVSEFENFSLEDKQKDEASGENLANLALAEINKEDNFLKMA